MIILILPNESCNNTNVCVSHGELDNVLWLHISIPSIRILKYRDECYIFIHSTIVKTFRKIASWGNIALRLIKGRFFWYFSSIRNDRHPCFFPRILVCNCLSKDCLSWCQHRSVEFFLTKDFVSFSNFIDHISLFLPLRGTHQIKW